MSTYTGTRVIRGATVHRYALDNTEEEKKEIVQDILRVCAESQRKKQAQTKQSASTQHS